MKKNIIVNEKHTAKNIGSLWRDKKMKGVQNEWEKIAKRNKKYVENLMNEMEGQPAEDIIKVPETKLVYWMNSSEFWYKEFMAQKEANE